MMQRQRSVATLVPGILVCMTTLGTSHVARAQQSSSASVALPAGVHLNGNGRYTKDMCDRGRGHTCFGHFLLPEDWKPGMDVPVVPQATAAAMSPTDIQTAYSIPASSKANGKIVAILDAPDSKAYTDLSGYRSHFGLPALPKCTGTNGSKAASDPPCFGQVNQDGGPSTGTDPSPNGDDGETALDMDMISAACPDCSILLVEIGVNFCESDFTQAVATATKYGASAISVSLGGPEATDPNAAKITPPADAGPPACPAEASWKNDTPGPYSSPGHLVFVASGDFAYDNNNIGLSKTIGGSSPSYPASSPWVIAVGGTTLYADGKGGYGEGVWNDGRFGLFQGTILTSFFQDVTTSGCSTEFAQPPWQNALLSGTTCKGRVTADLSAASNFMYSGKQEGIGLYLGGTFTSAEGTSAASPLVAALFTRLGLTTEASNDLSWIYKNASAFNDVGSSAYPLPSGASNTDAKSDSSCGILCTAGTGWDGPTGVGSPNGTKLAALPQDGTGPVPYPDAGVPIQGDAGVTDTSDAGTAEGSDSGTGGGGGGGGGGGSGGGVDSGTGGGGSDADGGDGDTGGTGGTGGCNTSSMNDASFAGLFALGAAVVAFSARRRRKNDA